MQDWEAAVVAYTHMIEVDPSNPKAHNNLGNAHFRRGDYEPAAENYRRAIELDENYLLAMFQYGWTLRQMNRETEAEPVFRRCLEVPAESARDQNTRVDCAFGLGSVRHRAGDYAASASLMEQVLSVHPGHPEARHYLGMAYRQLGRLEDAQRELELHRKMLEVRRKQGAAFDRPDPR
jgi:tetratricopeptide (TPR) repeat protein